MTGVKTQPPPEPKIGCLSNTMITVHFEHPATALVVDVRGFNVYIVEGNEELYDNETHPHLKRPRPAVKLAVDSGVYSGDTIWTFDNLLPNTEYTVVVDAMVYNNDCGEDHKNSEGEECSINATTGFSDKLIFTTKKSDDSQVFCRGEVGRLATAHRSTCGMIKHGHPQNQFMATMIIPVGTEAVHISHGYWYQITQPLYQLK